MKSDRAAAWYEVPLCELNARLARARSVLRFARSRVGTHEGASALHAALDEVQRLAPDVMDRPRPLLARAIRDLAPRERAALREAIDDERAARERRTRLLGDVLPADVEEALTRVEAQEFVAAELMSLLHLFRRLHCAQAGASH